MKKTLLKAGCLLLCLAFVAGTFAACGGGQTSPAAPSSNGGGATGGDAPAGDVVEVEYWQYVYDTKVELMDELIDEFNAANSNIRVSQQTFPYGNYEEKLSAAVASGSTPEIINIYFGWVPKYVKSGVLQELPSDYFTTASIEAEFAPMVQVNRFDSAYYTIPTAVRTLGLFYNKDILAANGFDPEKPPTTMEELVEMAQACTVYDEATGIYEIEGMTFQPTGQLHTWFRPVLLTQFGQQPMSDDNRTCLWNASQAGYDAFAFMTSLSGTLHLGENNFMSDDVTAFRQGMAAFSIDGSFRLGTLAEDVDLNYGVAPLPSYNGVQTSFGSFWTNGIMADVSGAQLDASGKFLEFLTSEEVMKTWTVRIGEIGAKVSLSSDPELLSDDKLAPFIEQIPSSISYFYVDEAGDRKAIVDAIDEVLINGTDPKDALDKAVEEVQAILDDYWNN